MDAPQRVIIETPRLILSDFQIPDFGAFSRLFDVLERSGQGWFNAEAGQPDSVRNFFTKIIANQHEDPRHTFRLAVRAKIASGETSQVIGYVSLCDTNIRSDSKPDTGILIDPNFQGSGYAREARLAIGQFGFSLGLKRLVCDIKNDNFPSISNVLAMGYEQVMLDGKPVNIETSTINGVQDWFRFRLTRRKFYEKLPELIKALATKHWKDCATEACGSTSADDFIKIRSAAEASSKGPHLPAPSSRALRDDHVND